MDYTDWMLLKLVFFFFAAMIYKFWETIRLTRPPESHEADKD